MSLSCFLCQNYCLEAESFVCHVTIEVERMSLSCFFCQNYFLGWGRCIPFKEVVQSIEETLRLNQKRQKNVIELLFCQNYFLGWGRCIPFKDVVQSIEETLRLNQKRSKMTWPRSTALEVINDQSMNIKTA
jgi:hypothetical protein